MSTPPKQGSTGNVQSPEIAENVENKSFAQEVREAYEGTPEKPKTIAEKVMAFISIGGKRLMKEFEQGSWLKKAAILGGVVGAGYLAYQGIKKIGQLISGGFKKLFGIGEDLKGDLEETKDGTMMSILKLALGGTLAIGTVTALYEAINGKISLVEIADAWSKDGVKGVGMLLLKKQKEGAISIGKDLWGAVAGTLGLPSLDTVKEKLGDVKDEIEKGYKWLDDKCHFGEVKVRMENFFKEHNIEMPNWIKNLSLAEMAKNMGIDENDAKTYAEYAVAGGAAILIYKWATTHGMKKGIMINAAVYLGIVNETTGEFGRKLIKALGNELDQAKKKLFDKWGADSQIAAYLEDMFGEFSIEKHLESSLEWIKEHPAESMLAMNGAWLLRGVVVKGLKLGAKATWNAAKFAVNNPGKTALVGLGAAALYVGRRDFITDFINLTYDNPNGKEAKEMQTNLDTMFDIDRSKAEGIKEKQVHDMFQSILEDPIKALNLKETQEAFEKNWFSFGFDIGGKIILLMKGMNLPVQLAGITKEAFKSLPLIYAGDYEGNQIAATTIVGTEILVLGSLTYMTGKEGLKATKAIFDINDKGAKAVGKVLWSLVPGTAEWRFVFKSMISAPLIPFMKNFQGMHVGTVEAEMKRLTAMINEPSPNFKKIQALAESLGNHHMFKDYEKIKESITGTRFGYEFAKKFGDVKRTVRSIEEAAKKNNAGEIDNIKNFIKDIERKTNDYRSGVSRLTERWELLKQGKFSESFAGRTPAEKVELAAKEEVVASYKPLNSMQTFRKADGTYKTEVEIRAEKAALDADISALDPASPLKKTKQKTSMALEAYLNPSNIDHMGGATAAEIGALDNANKASHLEDMAARMEAVEKGVQERFAQEVNSIVQDAKKNGLPLTDVSVKTQLEALQTKYIDPLARNKGSTLELIIKEYNALPKELRTPAMKAQIRNVLEGAEGRFATRLMKGAKGRMKLMAVMAGLMFTTDALVHRNDPEREFSALMNELGPDLGQLLVDVLPGVGTVSNFWSAIAGKEMVSGRDVSGAGERAGNVAWGIVGLAGDALMVLGSVPSGGTSVAANVFLRLTKAAKGGSKTAIKMIELWPRFEKLAEKMGGFKNLADKMLKFTRENKGAIAKTLRTTEKVSMATGTALLVGGVGYHLYFKETATPELDIPDDLKGVVEVETTPEPATTAPSAS